VRLPSLKVGYEDDGPFFPDAEATALRFAAERCRLHADLAPGLSRTKVACCGRSLHKRSTTLLRIWFIYLHL